MTDADRINKLERYLKAYSFVLGQSVDALTGGDATVEIMTSDPAKNDTYDDDEDMFALTLVDFNTHATLREAIDALPDDPRQARPISEKAKESW